MQRFLKINKEKIILLLVIVLGAFFRIYNINWDQGHHLHPDERAIVMFALPLHFPSSISEFLSLASPLNPHFFAYGNFPLYLLKGTAVALSTFNKSFDSYDKINLLGRAISAIADLGTIILIYFIGKKIFNKMAGTIAALFYSLSVFPIQAAHFYAVDTLLTFFITLTLWQLIKFYENPSFKNSLLSGVFFGFSLATKVSAIPLIIAIITTITLDFIFLVIKQPHKPHVWFPHIPRFLKRLILDGFTITISTIITFAILQPYTIIDFQEFWRQSMQQRQMTQDAFTFPYTLQYVGKTPYFYELKNIFLWGQGPILAILSFLGILYVTLLLIRNHLGGERLKTIKQFNNGTIILLIFFLVYFFVVGKFAVGWMRYMLPLYPLLSLFGATFALRLFELTMNLNLSKFSIFNFQFSNKSKKLNFKNSFQISNFKFQIGLLVCIGSIFVSPLSFMHIYTKPNTRVLASQWMYQNVSPNSVIAREHWDDGMPIGGNISYRTLELPIYEMENPLRETQIYQTVQEADYIIIASNRLYVPLQRLAENCQKWNLPKERCSKNASRYYKKLFNGELGYKKVAEFENPPTIPFINIPINDQNADESFTVYDHPKVMIFKKN